VANDSAWARLDLNPAICEAIAGTGQAGYIVRAWGAALLRPYMIEAEIECGGGWLT